MYKAENMNGPRNIFTTSQGEKMPSMEDTPPRPLASAAPRRTPRRASSQLMMPQWKPKTAINQYLYMRKKVTRQLIQKLFWKRTKVWGKYTMAPILFYLTR